ncbi:uncharacterized protein A1O9_13140, partial [Exophiala aquamarina CBS 119918]
MEESVIAHDELLRSLGLVIGSPERVLICTHSSCGYALQVHGKRVSRHLCEKHQIPKASRRGLDGLVASLNLRDPRLVGPRPNDSAPHPHLQMSHGYHCRFCHYLTASSKSSHQHRCFSADWSHATTREQDRDCTAEVLLQSWVREGTRTYWIVQLESPLPPQSVSGQIGDARQGQGSRREPSHLERLCQAEQVRLLEHREATRDEDLPDLATISPWMRRTQWLETYRRAERSMLVRMTALPDLGSRRNGRDLGTFNGTSLSVSAADERRISMVLQAIEELYAHCEETVQHTARPILCKLYSQSLHGSSQRPFRLVNRPASRSKYLRPVKKLFSFLLTMYLMDQEQCHLALNFYLTRTQRRAIHRLWDDSCWTSHAESPQDIPLSLSDEDSIDEEDGISEEELEDDLEGDEPEEEEVDTSSVSAMSVDTLPLKEDLIEPHNSSLLDQVVELVLELSVFLAMEEFSEGRPASTLLVYFSGILGMSPDGTSYHKIRNYTSNLAALIYYQRLIFLEWALPYRAYPYLGRSRRPSRDHVAVLQPIRAKYTCFGCLTPLPEFISLLSFSRTVAHTDGPSFQCFWSDDGQTISYENQSLHMDQFRSFSHSLVKRCRQLCTKLMYDWEPPVQLSQIRDNMSNVQRGYSFVHHPANHLSDVHLKLFQRVCTSTENGLMRNDQWVLAAVRRFLDDVDELLRVFCCLFLTTGGDDVRAVDLFTLECTNSPGNRRGIYVWNGHLITFTRHHKSRHIVDRDFQIIRKLPDAVARLFFYYLVYIRRAADMVRRECKMGGNNGNFLFSTGSRVWTASDLTRILRQYSQLFLQQPMSSRLYRQVAIAIMEKK